MGDENIDWSLTTFDGNRQRQREEFQRLPFREKLAIIEELGEIAERFSGGVEGAARRARTADGSPVAGGGSSEIVRRDAAT